MKVIDCVAYVLIALLALLASWLDRQDWECPDLYSERSECRPGIGMPIRDTEPSPTDTVCDSLKRIKKAAQAERQNVKWRQAMYMAIGLSFLIFLLVATPGSLPEWPTFYISVAVIFAFIYTHMNWYSYHRYSYAEQNINGNIDKVANLNRCTSGFT